MDAIEYFQTLGDLTPLELLPGGTLHYFCTPKNARLLARLGVDGIHFCVLPAPGDTLLERSPVYIVTPMDAASSQYVAPVARSLSDFVSYILVLRCAGVLALIQSAKLQDIRNYLAESDAAPFWGGRRTQALKALAQFPHTPCGLDREGIITAVRGLQQDKNLYRFHFTKEYYEVTGE